MGVGVTELNLLDAAYWQSAVSVYVTRKTMFAYGKLVLGAVAIGLSATVGAALVQRAQSKYVLHVYDHCPFCNRVEWLLQHYGISYERVVYRYGAGGDPEKHGYDQGKGPVPLTGKKMLPVLEGPGVPCAPDASGMPESMEICSFLIAHHQLVAPCDSGRDDVKKLTAELTALKPALVEDRLVQMPIEDWADARDVAYRRYKKSLPIVVPPITAQPELVAQLNAKLAEVPALLKGNHKGSPCLNAWGWGMDDVLLLPLLRAFTCVKGAAFPTAVDAYLNIEATQMSDYRKHAV